MAGRPLSPAIRLRLGRPLPHLLADRTRVSQVPDRSFYPKAYGVLAVVSNCCPPVLDKSSRVTHPSATMLTKKQASQLTPFDLHVLGTPPAFVLSQDQTLRLIPESHSLELLVVNSFILYAPYSIAMVRVAVFLFRLAPSGNREKYITLSRKMQPPKLKNFTFVLQKFCTLVHCILRTFDQL